MAARRGARPGPAARNGLTPAQTGPTRNQLSEIQRRRMLAAMAEVCAERRAIDVTVADVLERAGVSRRTFYELFEDREDCFVAAFEDAVARASRYVLDGYDPRARWVERVRGALHGALAFLDAELDAGWLVVVGSLAAGERTLERRALVLERIVALVAEGERARDGAELPPLTAESVVGGALAVIHARLQGPPRGAPLSRLAGQLMALVVLPYLGPAAARRELARPAPAPVEAAQRSPSDPLRGLGMRLTYRTIRVLGAVGAHPGASNREIGAAAGMEDQGQTSRLLNRLAKLGLIENTYTGRAGAGPNAWALTPKGAAIERATGAVGRERSTGPAAAGRSGAR